MKSLFLLPLFLVSFVPCSHPLWAREIPEYGQSIRALGMGNAYTAIVKDSDALFYNPAALSKINGLNFTLLNLNLGFSSDNAISLANSLSQSTGSGLSSFSDLFGEQVWLGARAKGAFTMPNFGVGTFGWGHLSLELKNPILPYFNLNYVNDYGFIIGGAFSVGDKNHFGLTIKRINRSAAESEVGVSDFLDGNTSSIQSSAVVNGIGYGTDLGFLIELPGPLKPVLSGVWKNIGNINFLKDTTVTKPNALEEEQILGVATGFDLFAFGMTAALDYKHINDNSEPMVKKLHMGLEMDLPLLDLRVGLGQGHYSIGTSMDFFVLQFDTAYYAVELGEYPGQDPDRRIELALRMDMGLDANFKLIDFQTAKKYRLKKRR